MRVWSIMCFDEFCNMSSLVNGPHVSVISATPTIFPDPFLMSATRPRCLVDVDRISQVLLPDRMRSICGVSIIKPFNWVIFFLPLSSRWKLVKPMGYRKFKPPFCMNTTEHHCIRVRTAGQIRFLHARIRLTCVGESKGPGSFVHTISAKYAAGLRQDGCDCGVACAHTTK